MLSEVTDGPRFAQNYTKPAKQAEKMFYKILQFLENGYQTAEYYQMGLPELLGQTKLETRLD